MYADDRRRAPCAPLPSLREFLKKYAALGLAADAGALFPKGMDKDWAAGDSVTFK